MRTTSVSLTSSTGTSVIFADYPIALTSTLEFQFALVYGLTVAGLLAVFFLLLRRKKPTAEVTEPSKPV